MNPIANALTQGFSHENILQYLLRHFPHARRQIEQALAKGFSAEKIVQFLQGGRQEVNRPITEHEQTRASHKQKQKDLENNIGKGALALGAAGLGAYALNRAIPQALQGELLPALPEGPLQIGMQQAPQQIAQQQQQLPFIQGQAQPINPPVAPVQAEAPIMQQTAAKIAPLPEAFQKQASALLEAGNNPEQIENILKALQPKIVKEYEKATNTPIRSAIEEFAKSLPAQTENKESALQQTIQQPAVNATPKQVEEKQDISAIGGMAKGMMENFYDGVFKSLQQGKDKFAGIKEPLIDKAKPYFQKGLIKSAEDLKEFANNPDKFKEKEQPKIEEKKTVALPNGDIGEITNIRQGIATINANGKEYRRKVEELIEPPIPEKDLAELHDELMKGIEKKTGQEISRMVNWAGYDPKTNELAFVPHMGALYVYDNISPDDASELTNLLTQRKSSGENFIGAWHQGTQSPIGAAMSKLIQKLQKERGGKGQEYKVKYEKIYDAIEPAKIASKQKFEEKQAAKREEKKSEKEKAKKEKEIKNPKPKKKKESEIIDERLSKEYDRLMKLTEEIRKENRSGKEINVAIRSQKIKQIDAQQKRVDDLRDALDQAFRDEKQDKELENEKRKAKKPRSD